MHWTLDMDFDEDRSRARREDIAENFAMLRLDKSVFGGISVKRKELTWDDDKHRILEDWVRSERPQPRIDIVEFERLTGRQYPR